MTPAELQAALAEPVVLVGDRPLAFKAPQFTWQVRRQLDAILGAGRVDRDRRLHGDHDARLARPARWPSSGSRPRRDRPEPQAARTSATRLLQSLKIGAADRAWINALRGKDLHNGALVALDYRTGDVLAYAGSAGYYRDNLASRKFEPKYDAAGDGARQPGSACKPILYASAFDTKQALTPGSLLLDITTEFARPGLDAARRRPARARTGPRPQGAPVLAEHPGDPGAAAGRQRGGRRPGAKRSGIRFTGGDEAVPPGGPGRRDRDGRGPAARPDLGLRHDRERRRPRAAADDPRGPRRRPARSSTRRPQPKRDAGRQPAGGVPRHRHPPGQHRPEAEPDLGDAPRDPQRARTASTGPSRSKTGTANDARDLATYGYLAPARRTRRAGLAVGLWMGNSDHSNPRTTKPAISLTAAAPLWRAFVRDVTRKSAGRDVQAAEGRRPGDDRRLVRRRPGPWTREHDEGVVHRRDPARRPQHAVDRAGLLYTRACGGWRVDPVKAELGPTALGRATSRWLARARRGAGVIGRFDTRTAYFWGRAGWGGPLAGPCAPKPKPPMPKGPKPPKDPGPGGGGGHGGGGGRRRRRRHPTRLRRPTP